MADSTNVPIILAGLSLALVGYGLVKLSKAGLFQRVLFDVKTIPNDKVFLVKTYKGQYKEVGSKFTNLFKLIAGRTNWDETVGIYYDSPDRVGPKNCRYSVGLCLKADDTEFQKFMIDNGYTVVRLENNLQALHTTFPFEGPLSVWLSIAKVYPACFAELKRRNLSIPDEGAVLEITRCGQSEFYFMIGPAQSKEIIKTREGAISS